MSSSNIISDSAKKVQNPPLSILPDLNPLKDERKWYQMCKMICEIINGDNAQDIWHLFLDNISQYHPSTLTETALAMTRYYSSEKAMELISKCISAIRESNMYSGNFKMQIVHLEIQKSILMVENSNLEDIESKIFEFKKFEMDPEVFDLYNYLAFVYYEKTQNYEYCVKYLLEFVKKGKTSLQFLEILAKYSLISKNFYNFIEVFSIRDFNKINEDIQKVYVAVQEGNVKLIDSYKNILDVLFGEKAEIVREKAYYIGLINLCFRQEERNISFLKIQEELKISSQEIDGFLLKAFGLGLIKGWIDGSEKVLYYNTIIPRCLPDEELYKMMNKFGDWKNKVRQAISMIEK